MFRPPNETKQDSKRMVSHRYVVPAELKGQIIYQLDNVGINEASLFPNNKHRIKSIVSAVYKESRADGNDRKRRLKTSKKERLRPMANDKIRYGLTQRVNR